MPSFSFALSQVGFTRAQHAHLKERHEHQTQEEHRRHGRGIAHAHADEALLVDVPNNCSCCRSGTALGRHGDRVEDLKRTDHARHQHKDQHGPQKRQGDQAKRPPFRGAFDTSRLVEVLGNRLQPGVEEKGGVAHVTPDVDESDRRQRQTRIAEEGVTFQPEAFQEHVYKPQDGVEHLEPDHRGDNVRDQEWGQHDRADEDRTGQPLQKNRDQQPKHRLNGNVVNNVKEGDPNRTPELLVVEEPDVVVQADKLRRPHQVPVRQTDVKGANRRQKIKQRETEERRGDEQQAAERFAAKEPRTRARRAPRRRRPPDRVGGEGGIKGSDRC